VKRFLRDNWLTLLVVAGLALGYALLRTPQGTEASADALLASLSAGDTSIVEFYSNT
jgi:hypothetical protein